MKASSRGCCGEYARRLEQGVEWLVEKARRLSGVEDVSFARALTRVYSELVGKPPFRHGRPLPRDSRFFCDAGLGGLAWWSRAVGYEACWESRTDDADLLRRASHLAAVVLTTDSLLTERGSVGDGALTAFWLPPTLKIREQLKLVLREFGLQPRGHVA
jgi:hypothetical protein